MSQQPIENPPPRRRSDAPREQAGRRRPIRERLAHAGLKAPTIRRPSRKALTWSGAILVLIAAIAAFLVAIWDWNWFRGPLERLASARLHREVRITGDLDADIWSWRPSATVEGITIANPAWAKGPQMGSIERLGVRVRLVPLLWGKLDTRVLTVDRPKFDLMADAQGRKNWDFSEGRRDPPADFPPIQHFIVRDGRLTYVDAQRKIRFEGSINARERLGEGSQGFQLLGRGTINGAPFRAEVTGGPLLNIERTKPYPFEVEVRAGDTFVTARGAVPRPFDMAHFYMHTTVRGPDLAELFPLTGVALPNTPPYSLRGRISRDDFVWKIDNLAGRVGDSDLAGDVSFTTGRERPLLKADLRSNSLDFDDLGAVFGAAPKVGPGETASASQVAVARTMVAQQRIFSDAPLDVSRIRAMDADVRYRALSIRDTPIKLTAASVEVKPEDGLLRADPVRLDLPQGRVQGQVALNARGATPTTNLDLRLSGARLENLIPISFKGAPPATGTLVGRARLSGSGNTLHKTFGGADGQITLVAPAGEIRESIAELMGVNVIKGLGLLNKKDTTELRCAVASFRGENGVLRAERIVLDTGPVVIRGKGAIDLDRERLDLQVRGENKKLRLVRVLLPVRMSGPLMAPKLGVEPGAAIAQGAGGLALGSFLSPLAAILPFIDPGLAKDANCAGLVSEARAEGAPVARPSARAR